MLVKVIARQTLLGLKLVVALLVPVLGVSTISSIAGASTKASGTAPLRIAVVAATSGVDAHIGKQIVAGVKAAVGALNSNGGAGGHKVDVKYENTASSVGTAVKELRTLAKSGIDLLIGATSNQACTAMVPVAKKLGVTMVSPTCNAAALAGSHPAPNYFQVAPSVTDFAVGTDILVFRANPTIKTFVLSVPDSPTSASMEKRVEETLHYTDTAVVSATLRVPLTASSVTSYVSQIASKGGSTVGLISFTSGSTLVAMLKAEVAGSVLSHYAEVWASVAPTTVLGAMGASVPNMWLSDSYYYGGFSNAANSAFVNRFTELGTGDPTPVNEMAYVAAQAIAAGVARAHSVDAAAIAKAIKGVSINSPEGIVTVNATTHLVGQDMLAIHVTPTSTGSKVVQTISIPFTTFNYSG